MRVVEVETPSGVARAHVDSVPSSRGTLVLGHGAGGGVGAPDLVAAGRAARAGGLTVVFVEQPYRVARRRSPAPAAHLDAAWTAVVERLASRELRGLPIVAGGRSSGARVACRTAGETGAVGVLCLAFPLRPPARGGRQPGPSRLPELDAVTVPTLVVQGSRDRFGIPPPGPKRKVVEVSADHALKRDLATLAAAVEEWLARVVPPRT